jgi:hypothetical protein
VRCTTFVHRDMTSASLCGRGSILRASQSWIFYGVKVADVEASATGMIEGAASMMTVEVDPVGDPAESGMEGA